MRNDQLAYLKTRIREEANKKDSAIRQERSDAINLVDEKIKQEMVKAFQSGKVKTKPKFNRIFEAYTSVQDVFDLRPFKEKAAKQTKEVGKKFDERLDKLEQRQTVLMDTLVLGDAQEGLTLLEAFMNERF
jgi:hypothetical protein